jgi:hypothetical protein
MNAASAQDTAPSRIDNITKSARDMIPAMPAMPSISLPAMPDLSLPDFSDATGRLMTEFNTFTQEVGDALPILEQMGYEVTTFKVTWGLTPEPPVIAFRSTRYREHASFLHLESGVQSDCQIDRNVTPSIKRIFCTVRIEQGEQARFIFGLQFCWR